MSSQDMLFLDRLIAIGLVVMAVTGAICLNRRRKWIRNQQHLAGYLRLTTTAALISILVGFVMVVIEASYAWWICMGISVLLLIETRHICGKHLLSH